MVWLDLGFKPGLLDHWWTLQPSCQIGQKRISFIIFKKIAVTLNDRKKILFPFFLLFSYLFLFSSCRENVYGENYMNFIFSVAKYWLWYLKLLVTTTTTTTWEFFTAALADGFPLEVEWQQVSRTLLSILAVVWTAVVWTALYF